MYKASKLNIRYYSFALSLSLALVRCADDDDDDDEDAAIPVVFFLSFVNRIVRQIKNQVK